MAQKGGGKGGSAGGSGYEGRRGSRLYRPPAFGRAGPGRGRCPRQKKSLVSAAGQEAQPPPGREVQRPILAPGAQQDGLDPRCAQGILADPQQGRDIPGPDQQQVLGLDAHLLQSGAVRTPGLHPREVMDHPHQTRAGPSGQHDAQGETMGADGIGPAEGVKLMHTRGAERAQRGSGPGTGGISGYLGGQGKGHGALCSCFVLLNSPALPRSQADSRSGCAQPQGRGCQPWVAACRRA